MKLFRSTMTAAALLTVFTVGAQAQSVDVKGNTKGCFGGSSCTATTNSSSGGLSFKGLTFDWDALASGPVNVNLGQLTVDGNGWWGIGGFDTNFKLLTTFTTPVTTPTSGSYLADLDGNFVFSPGNVYLDFTNSTREYAFDGGTLTLKVNDLTFYDEGTKNVTGTLTYQVTATPEPSTMALLGTGLVGLFPMVRRRRKA